MSKHNSDNNIYQLSGLADETLWELQHSGLDIKRLSRAGSEQRTNEDKVNHFGRGGAGAQWGRKGSVMGTERRGTGTPGVHRQHPQG